MILSPADSIRRFFDSLRKAGDSIAAAVSGRPTQFTPSTPLATTPAGVSPSSNLPPTTTISSSPGLITAAGSSGATTNPNGAAASGPPGQAGRGRPPIVNARGQAGKQPPQLTNLHRKYIPVKSGAIHIDSMSLVPGAFFIKDVGDSAFALDWVNATLAWKHPPANTDSVLVTYRSFSRRLNAPAKRFSYDSIENNFLAHPFVFNSQSQQNDAAFFNFGNITYNGSFGRSISFGNSQDAVVTSNLNLQISGFLADSIEISAAITDNNIPIQPDGTTADLNEFDKIFLQFKKKDWALTMGDIDLRQNQNYFLNFYKRLQGATFETTTRISPTTTNHALVSAAVAKGKFTRNIFEGLEGNQGPYKLQGANNETYFIVLAGTEKVYIDGVLMSRGEDQDYVINYNTAEITFTAKRMITQDARIQVEFEYADRNYLNVNLYLADEATIDNKLKLRMALFSNSDARNSPINQSLTSDQNKFLAKLGDSINRAFYPVSTVDTFSAGKILYKRIDTTYKDASGNTLHDSAFVFSADATQTLYNLSFANVGQGYGNYVINDNGVNGTVYMWVAPVNGVMQGAYEAAQFLVTPKTQRVMTFGADYAINKNTTISGELAHSHYDINTISSIDKANDNGIATKWQFTNKTPISQATKGLTLASNLGYEYVQGNFKPLERLRNVEFTRDWGLSLNVNTADEKIYTGGMQLSDKKGNLIRYDLGAYKRSDGFTGVKNTITHRQQLFGWQVNDVFSYTKADSTNFTGYFWRPSIDISKKLKHFKDYLFGATWSMERNMDRDKTADTVTAASYAFQTYTAYLKSPDKNPNHWGTSFTTRENSYPYGQSLLIGDRSRTVNLFADFTKSAHHQVHFTATYRNLKIVKPSLTTQTADNSLLGRVEFLANEWKGLLRGNLLYEVGSGQEQKKTYTYVQVNAGTGQYTWIDANGDGIQQLSEFVLAQFSDQATYIKVYSASNEYVKANYATLNYSFTITPRNYITEAKPAGIRKILVRSILQSSLQMTQKQQSKGFIQLNPFNAPLDDTSLITRSMIFVNTFSYNRTNPKWGIDFTNTRNGSKTLLTYGYEVRQLIEWMMRVRWNVNRMITFTTSVRNGTNMLNNSNSNVDSSNFHLHQYSAEPGVTITKGANFRMGLGYKLSYKLNDPVYGDQKYTSSAYSFDCKYNILQSTSIQSKFTYSDILYKIKGANASTTSSVSYTILEGLAPGKNYQWDIDLTKKLGNNLEFSLQYEGRKAGSANIVHTGRASLRALL